MLSCTRPHLYSASEQQTLKLSTFFMQQKGDDAPRRRSTPVVGRTQMCGWAHGVRGRDWERRKPDPRDGLSHALGVVPTNTIYSHPQLVGTPRVHICRWHLPRPLHWLESSSADTFLHLEQDWSACRRGSSSRSFCVHHGTPVQSNPCSAACTFSCAPSGTVSDLSAQDWNSSSHVHDRGAPSSALKWSC